MRIDAGVVAQNWAFNFGWVGFLLAWAGLGLGVPWTPRYPLTESYAGATGYTHVVVLWWWLKLGLPGLVKLGRAKGPRVAAATGTAGAVGLWALLRSI